MTPMIEQSVEFNVSPEELWELYMDSTRHSRATGQRASISRKTGGNFTAFDGALCGKNLVIVPRKMIVQAWRAKHWPKADLDSILVLRFSGTKTRGRVDLAHVKVPEHDHKGVTEGWHKYYWAPWREYLKVER
jgi:activator of HSP90 ATPase